MSPLNRKAGERRLVNMAAEPARPWAPELPPDGPPYELWFPLSEDAKFLEIFTLDKYQRLVDWAVIQMRRVEGRWQRVAVYDVCHGKGVHVHLFNRQEIEFTETPLRPVESYADMDAGLEYVLKRVSERWQEDERRSDRGY